MRRAAAFAAAALLGAATVCAAEAPPWLLEAAAAPDDPAWGDAPLAELLHDDAITFAADGKLTERERRVVRVRAAEGHDLAGSAMSYDSEADRIVSVKAWVVHPDGRRDEIRKDAIHDVAQVDAELYDAYRACVVSAGDLVEDGAVVGVEFVREGRTIFAQQGMSFQGSAPVVLARFTLTLPEGWDVRAQAFNCDAPIEPQRTGQTWTWEMRGLPWIPDEPLSPPRRARVPWLGVNCVPPPGAPVGKTTAALDSWSAWAAWLHGRGLLADVESPALRTQALQCVAGATTRRDSLARLARFVQNLRYTLVIADAAHGGGVTPHPACDVLAHGYGDCKDKASLLRTMMRVVGIEARLVSAFSGDADHIRPEWPSLTQFNHCIVAIAAPESLAGEPIVRTADGARWLLFDPTDPYTRLGDLPEDLQGSFVLVRGADGSLVRVPRRSATDNALTTRTDIVPDSTGAAQVHTRWLGRFQAGRELLATWRAESPRDHRARLEHEVARVAPGAVVASMQLSGDSTEIVAEDVDYSAPRWLRAVTGGRRSAPLVWLPLDLSFGDDQTPRTQPLLLDDAVRRDTVVIHLAQPIARGPLLEPVQFDSPAGRYTASAVSDGDAILIARAIELHRQTLPASTAQELRSFLRAIRTFEAQRLDLAAGW